LIANDHLLKARFPGVLTGKLSDVAGMIVAPLFVVAIADFVAPARLRARRAWSLVPWAAAAAVAAAFALVKTWPPATATYAAAIAALRGASRVDVVRDPTDLFALPFGAVSALVARRATRQT
jgi:hypothetical protein